MIDPEGEVLVLPTQRSSHHQRSHVLTTEPCCWALGTGGGSCGTRRGPAVEEPWACTLPPRGGHLAPGLGLPQLSSSRPRAYGVLTDPPHSCRRQAAPGIIGHVRKAKTSPWVSQPVSDRAEVRPSLAGPQSQGGGTGRRLGELYRCTRCA